MCSCRQFSPLIVPTKTAAAGSLQGSFNGTRSRSVTGCTSGVALDVSRSARSCVFLSSDGQMAANLRGSQSQQQAAAVALPEPGFQNTGDNTQHTSSIKQPATWQQQASAAVCREADAAAELSTSRQRGVDGETRHATPPAVMHTALLDGCSCTAAAQQANVQV